MRYLRRHNELDERLLQSEKKRREENERKCERVKQMNQAFQRKLSDLAEKKGEEERPVNT